MINLLVLFLFSLSLFPSEKVFKRGMASFRKGRYFQALKDFESIRSQSSFQERADFAIATCLERLGLTNLAVARFGELIHKGPKRPFFRASVKEIASIYEKGQSAGRAITYEMFRESFPTVVLPTESRGFYHYFLALRQLEKKNLVGAKRQFLRVPKSGFFYGRSQYLLGVISALNKEKTQALKFFLRSVSATSDDFQSLAKMGAARMYYELKDYRRSLGFYSQIPRESVHWPQSLLEGSVSFFQMQRHNNTIGNTLSVLSPFFDHRFLPEAYIVNAITFLKLCHYDEAKAQIRLFRKRYEPALNGFRRLILQHRARPETFYSRVHALGTNLDGHDGLQQALNELRRTGVFLEGERVQKALKREGLLLRKLRTKVTLPSLAGRLESSLKTLRLMTARQVGEELLYELMLYGRHVQNLVAAAGLLLFDLEAGKTDLLRARYQQQGGGLSHREELWGEGMKPLVLTQEIEYWPVKREWWADEVGSTVSEVPPLCQENQE